MTTTPEAAARPLRTLDTALIVGATIEEARRYPGGHLELTLSNGVTLRSTNSTIEEPKRCGCAQSDCGSCSADSWVPR